MLQNTTIGTIAHDNQLLVNATNYTNICDSNLTFNMSNSTLDCGTAISNKIINSSSTYPCFHRTVIYPWFILSLLVILVNISVLILIRVQRRRLLKCSGNIILTSLSINDLFNGCINMLYIAMRIYETEKTSCISNKTFLSAFYYVDKMLLLNSIFHLVFLATERMISFCSPIRHRVIVTKTRTMVCVFTAWIMSSILSPLEKYFDGTESTKMMIYGVLLLVPTAIIFVQYLIMLGIIFRYMAARNNIANHLIGNRQKPCLIYLLMFISFLALGTPMVSVAIYDQLFGDRSFMKNNYELLEAFIVVRILPCLLNPFIYVFTKEDFRKEIKRYTKRYRSGENTTTRRPTTKSSTANTTDTGVKNSIVSRLLSNNDRVLKDV